MQQSWICLECSQRSDAKQGFISLILDSVECKSDEVDDANM